MKYMYVSDKILWTINIMIFVSIQCGIKRLKKICSFCPKLQEIALNISKLSNYKKKTKKLPKTICLLYRWKIAPWIWKLRSNLWGLFYSLISAINNGPIMLQMWTPDIIKSLQLNSHSKYIYRVNKLSYHQYQLINTNIEVFFFLIVWLNDSF